VDRIYARSLARAKIIDDATPDPQPSSTDIVSSSAPSEEPYSFQRHIQLLPDYDHPPPPPYASQSPTTHTSTLTNIFNSLPIPPAATQFLPADENLPFPISALPAELMEPIFSHLDVASMERFATTCWRARYLTAHAELWSRLVRRIYLPPYMVAPTFSLPKTLSTYNNEQRSLLITEPRLRLDGVYISLCHYIRPGAGDAWVTVTHMITYHRFLRFYPDGVVVSYLTTDMPGEVVPALKRGLRGKGMHLGRWRLEREEEETATEEIEREKAGIKTEEEKGSIARSDWKTGREEEDVLREKAARRKDRIKGKGKAKIVITDLFEPGITPKYEFEMDLSLKETGRGRWVPHLPSWVQSADLYRWNKLEIRDYRSINLATEESLSLSLKHQKPFYFSK
jgi:F-box protein 9